VAGLVGGGSSTGTATDRPGGIDHYDRIRRCCTTLRNPRRPPKLDTLLTIEQAAERLGTLKRFVRRLIAERRIA
jgi:hypothetical protein